MNRLCCWITLGFAAAALAGCFTTRIYVQDRTGGRPSNVEKKWYHGGIFGLVEFSDPIMLDSVCPQGVARIEQEETFLNGLVKQITQGLYTPQTVTVYCVDGRTARLEIGQDGQLTTCASPS